MFFFINSCIIEIKAVILQKKAAMRNLEPKDITLFEQHFNRCDIPHIVFSKSWIEETDGIIISVLIVDNNTLVGKEITPLDDNTKEILSNYMNNYKQFNTYHIALMYDKTHTGMLLNMYSEFLKTINVGDHIWITSSNKIDEYNIKELGGYVKISENIYLIQYIT